MEEMNKSFDVANLIEKLKSNNPQAESLVRDFKSALQQKHLSKNWEVFADMGDAYEQAGLLEKAKNAYYDAYAHAEKANEFSRASELLAKSKTLPGTIQD